MTILPFAAGLTSLVDKLADFTASISERRKSSLRWNFIEHTAIKLTKGDPTLQGIRDRLLRPLAQITTRFGLKPAHISILGVFFAIAASFSVDNAVIFVALLIGNMICDGLDGVVARYQELDSDAGAVLDVLCDTFSILIVTFGLYLHQEISIWLALTFGAVTSIYSLASMIKSKLLCGVYRSVGSRIFTFVGFALIATFSSGMNGLMNYNHFLIIITTILATSFVVEKMKSGKSKSEWP